MTTDGKIRDENSSTILTERPQKYQSFYLEKLINVNILQVKKYYRWIIEE